MHERIKALIERAEYQAGKHSGSDWQVYVEPSREQIFEKFAELIIKECAKQAYEYICDNENQRYWDDVGSDCIPGDTQSHIKEYFGVK